MYIDKILNKINSIQNKFNLLTNLNQIGGNNSLKQAYICKISNKIENIIHNSKLLNNFGKVIYQSGGSDLADKILETINKSTETKNAPKLDIKNSELEKIKPGKIFEAIYIDVDKINKELQTSIVNLNSQLKLKSKENEQLNRKIQELEERTTDESDLQNQLYAKNQELVSLSNKLKEFEDEKASNNEKISELKEKIKKLESQNTSNDESESLINTLRNEKESLETANTELRNELDSLREQIADKDKQILIMTKELETEQEKIKELEKTIDELKTKLSNQPDLSKILAEVEKYRQELVKCKNQGKQPNTEKILDIKYVNDQLLLSYKKYDSYNIEKPEIRIWAEGEQDEDSKQTMAKIYKKANTNIDRRYDAIRSKYNQATTSLKQITNEKRQIVNAELREIKEKLSTIKENANKYNLTEDQKSLEWKNLNQDIDSTNILKNPVIYSTDFEAENDKILITEITKEYDQIINRKNQQLKEISSIFEPIISEFSDLKADVDSFNGYIDRGPLLNVNNKSEWENNIKNNGAGNILLE